MTEAADLKAKTAGALQLRDALKARAGIARKNPTTWARYQRVMADFDGPVARSIQAATGVYTSVRDAFSRVLSSALNDVDDVDGDAGLGFVWVAVPLAIAAVVKWRTDAEKLKATLDAQAAMVAAGATPEAAARAVQGSATAADGSTVGSQVKDAAGAIGKAALALGVVGLAWGFRDELKALFKKKRKG